MQPTRDGRKHLIMNVHLYVDCVMQMVLKITQTKSCLNSRFWFVIVSVIYRV